MGGRLLCDLYVLRGCPEQSTLYCVFEGITMQRHPSEFKTQHVHSQTKSKFVRARATRPRTAKLCRCGLVLLDSRGRSLCCVAGSLERNQVQLADRDASTLHANEEQPIFAVALPQQAKLGNAPHLQQRCSTVRKKKGRTT